MFVHGIHFKVVEKETKKISFTVKLRNLNKLQVNTLHRLYAKKINGSKNDKNEENQPKEEEVIHSLNKNECTMSKIHKC